MARDPVRVYLESLSSEGSQKSMRNVIVKFLREQMGATGELPYDYPWSKVTLDDVSGFKQQLEASGASLAAINSMLAGVRGVLYKAIFSDDIDDIQRLPIDVYPLLKRIRTFRPTHDVIHTALTKAIHEQIFASLSGDNKLPSTLRDKALIAALWGSGLTADDVGDVTIVGELAKQLPVGGPCLSLTEKCLYIPRLDKSFEFTPDDFDAIECWVREGLQASSGHLFVRIRQERISYDEPLTKSGVEFVLKTLRERLQCKSLTLRNLRNAPR